MSASPCGHQETGLGTQALQMRSSYSQCRAPDQKTFLCFLPGGCSSGPKQVRRYQRKPCVGTRLLGWVASACPCQGRSFHTSSQAPTGPHGLSLRAPRLHVTLGACGFGRWRPLCLGLWGRRPCAGSGQPLGGETQHPGAWGFCPSDTAFLVLVSALPSCGWASGPVFVLFSNLGSQSSWSPSWCLGPGLGSRLGIMALGGR